MPCFCLCFAVMYASASCIRFMVLSSLLSSSSGCAEG
jgi:hypothetical protein